MGVLVGKPAPDFTAAAVLGNGEIVDSYSFPPLLKVKSRSLLLPTGLHLCVPF